MQEWCTKYFNEEYLLKYGTQKTEERTIEEVDFIVRALNIKRGQNVLDMPCGFGRHTNELINRGIDAHGVDLTRIFIDKAVAYHPNREDCFVCADMRYISEDLHTVFDNIFNFFTSFGYYSDEDNSQVIANISQLLKDNGKFLIHVRNREWLLQNFVKNQFAEYGDRTELIRREFDLSTSRMNTHLTFCHNGIQDKVTQSIRFYSLTEMTKIFHNNGLKVIQTYGDIKFESYTINSEWMVVIGQKI